MEVTIAAHHLTKRYDQAAGWRRQKPSPGILAVDDVTLTVEKGELFGLLGPNGAGKTTLVKTLCTLVSPSSGTATVAGYSLEQAGKIRQAIGLVVSDERSFYWRLSGRRNLLFFAAMYGLQGAAASERIDQVLAEVNMLPHADRRFSNYSTGMRQRLAIARSLLHRPGILFMDEPSRSLDPTATNSLHELILALLNSQDVTIFLITHDLAEAEKLCSRVAVMHRGKIRVTGRPAELRRQLQPQQRYSVKVSGLTPAAEQELMLQLPGLSSQAVAGQMLLNFQAGENDGRLAIVFDCLRDYRVEIQAIESQPPSLEEVFAHYTGRDGEER